ncbi:unnamed protein product, partial [Allacma fusca]
MNNEVTEVGDNHMTLMRIPTTTAENTTNPRPLPRTLEMQGVTTTRDLVKGKENLKIPKK